MRTAKRWRRRLTDPLVYVGLAFLVHLAGALPRGVRRWLGRFGAWLFWHGSRGCRRTVLANLNVAFPELSDDQRLDLGRRSLVNAAWNALDFMHLLHSPGAVLEQVVLDQAMESLKDPLAPPTLVVMPHLGSWELLGQAISLHGVRAAAVAHPLRNPLVDRMLTRARAAHGLQIIPSDGAVRGISRAVREGRHIGILVDQNTRPGEGGIFVRFFGLPVTVSRGPAVLARRLGLRVLVAACLRQEGGFRMRSLELARPVSVYGTEEALMQAIIEANEGLIRGCPEQYLWTYRRWRYLPAGLDPERASAFPFYAQPYVQRPRKRRRART